MSGQVRTIEDLRGPAGRLEALLNTGAADAPYVALVAHPHPLGGGTMHNKVVYHAAKVFSGFGLPVLRFNYRGVGLSEGVHDGRAEMDDIRAALDWLEHEFQKPILFAGFSFGANLGLRVCCGDARVKGIVGLGLPVEADGRKYEYSFLPGCGNVPKLFVIGADDPFAPQAALTSALEVSPPPTRTVWVKGADHFFAGTTQSPTSKLGVMSETMRLWLAGTFGL